MQNITNYFDINVSNVLSTTGDILNSKILTAPIILIIFGGIIINYIRRKWSIHDKKEEEERNNLLTLKKEQISFLNEIAISLHNLFPILFNEIKRNNFSNNNILELDKARIDLFKIRFSVFIKSKSYFNNENFSDKFDKLIINLDDMVQIFIHLSENTNTKTSLYQKYFIITINEIKDLQKNWIMQAEKYKIDDYNIKLELRKIENKENITVQDISRVMNYRASLLWLRSRELLEETLEKHVLG